MLNQSGVSGSWSSIPKGKTLLKFDENSENQGTNLKKLYHETDRDIYLSPGETWISLAELFWCILLPIFSKNSNWYNLGMIYKKWYWSFFVKTLFLETFTGGIGWYMLS